MRPLNRSEGLYFCLALLVPAVFFTTLPWNPEYGSIRYLDHFFGADAWRVYQNLIGSDEVTHYRDKVHPYFSLFAVTTAKIGKLLGTEGGEFLAYRSIFGTAGAFLFWLFIYRCTSAVNAFASVALLLSTMTVRVWSVIPETHIFGFFTLMLALNLARTSSNVVATLITTMSATITNGAVGFLYILQGIRTLDWKRTILVIALAVLLLSSIQKSIYPTSVHFFDVFALREEKKYVNLSPVRMPFRAFDFVYSGFVLPLPEETMEGTITTDRLWATFGEAYDVAYDNRQALTIAAALIAITAYLLAALASFIKSARMQDVGALVAGFIVFEFLLHLVYGMQPFLYSYNFLPFLIIFIALYLPGEKARPFLLLLLALCLQEANFSQWHRIQQLFA